MVKNKKIKVCSLCFEEINTRTKFNIFKHNTLFKDGDKGIWACLMRHYVCENCLKKLQEHCQEGCYAQGVSSNNDKS